MNESPQSGRAATTTVTARSRRGVLLILVTAGLWSFNGPLIKLLDGAGTSAWTIAFYRSLFAALVLTPFALRKIHTLRFDPRLIVSVLVFTAMTAAFVLATTLTHAANAIFLQYTAPAWVFILSPLLLRERAERRDVVVLATALCGVAVIFTGQGATSHPPGLVVGLAAGLFFGLLTLVLRHVRQIDALLVSWINNLGSAVLLLPAAALSTLSLDREQFILLILLGVFQFGIPYLLYTKGLQYVPAHRAVLLILMEPVLNPTWTFLIVGEVPASTTLAGGGLILAAVVLQVVLTLRRFR